MPEKKKNSEQRDSNPRPTAPKAAALAKLRYTPILSKENETLSHSMILSKQKKQSIQKK